MMPSTKVRGFRLVVEAGDTDIYGLRLEETNGSKATSPKTLIELRAAEVGGLMETLQQALRASHQQRTALSAARRKPIPLDESSGVRLAVALLTVQPISRRSRREAILGGVAAMSTEEAYYWFSRVTGPVASRARRALRILLADDGRSGIS
jgi:hypothetical protein